MRRVSIGIVCLVLAIGVFSFEALGQVPASERTLVTDPNLLEKMGFPRDATNVYIANMTAAAKATTDVPASPDFYGLYTSYTNLGPKTFGGREDLAGSWQFDGGAEGCCVNLSRKGTEVFADATLEIPEGVDLQFVRYWAYDTNASFDMDFYLFESCWPSYGAGPTTITNLVSVSTSGSSGAQSNFGSLTNYTVNNRDCNLTQRVAFRATTGLTLQKFRYQWQRQVSPAPAVASFTDVPTNYWAFQYIEALKASGITGGVTPTTYQPESPVTRAQMAVFLAKALGLYWP